MWSAGDVIVPSFAYQAVDHKGNRRGGLLEAPSARAASSALESSGLFIVEISQPSQGVGATPRGGSERRAVLALTRALAALLAAGVPLARALSAARLSVPPRVAEIVDLIRREVERGSSLAAALSAQPQLFSPLYVGVVRAAEKSGELASGFNELAVTLERQQQLRDKLVSLSIYPILLATVGSAAVVLLIAVVMPRFVSLLEGTGASLPASTAFLLSLASVFRRYGVILPGLGVATVIAAGMLLRTERGAILKSRLLVQLPLVGALRRETLAGRFARLSGVLIHNGAPVLNALADAGASLADPLATREVERIRTQVREGSTLHGAIAAGTLFPPLLPQLVAVGEESGRLSIFLQRAAEMFERNTERSLERLVALLEPAMIVAFGGIVAFVALALLQAIYGLNAGGLR
ncbi:MAG: type II secretion system F family protein [Gemmatimonadota bacterium]